MTSVSYICRPVRIQNRNQKEGFNKVTQVHVLCIYNRWGKISQISHLIWSSKSEKNNQHSDQQKKGSVFWWRLVKIRIYEHFPNRRHILREENYTRLVLLIWWSLYVFICLYMLLFILVVSFSVSSLFSLYLVLSFSPYLVLSFLYFCRLNFSIYAGSNKYRDSETLDTYTDQKQHISSPSDLKSFYTFRYLHLS